MRRFVYQPQSWTHSVSYAVGFALVLPLLSWQGAAVWATLHDTLGGWGAFVGLGFAVYMIVFWLAGGFYIAADARGWFADAKIQPRPAGRDRSGPPLSRAVRVVLRNQFLGTLPVLIGLYPLLLWRGLDMAADPDPWWLVLAHLAGLVLIEELGFYSTHRAFHLRPLFKRFHRIHHEFRESIGIATHYVHYVEHLVGNLGPIFLGVVILCPHPVTIFLWVVLAVVNAIHTHSGYAFRWMVWPHDHDFHHFNVTGNYGVLGALDRLLGTDDAFREVARSQRAGLTPPAA